MLHVTLYEPEIPPNTGNIIRLCANAGAKLHLIKPLGFSLTDRQLKRAGLDYHDLTDLLIYENYNEFLQTNVTKRIIACSTKGKKIYSTIKFQDEDILLFGPETRGLPKNILTSINEQLIAQIPMRKGNRSLNLANAVAIILYEAWRQLDFA